MEKGKLIIHPGESCIAVQINSDKTYGLLHVFMNRFE